MSQRHLMLAAAFSAVAVIGLGVWMMSGKSDHATKATDQGTMSVVLDDPARPPAAGPTPDEGPPASRPPSATAAVAVDPRTAAELLAASRSNDSVAADALRAKQKYCSTAPISADDAAARVKENLQGADREAALQASLAKMKECADYQRLGADVHLEILLRAAQAGDARARWEYASDTPRKLTGPTAMEEFKLYREAAQALLNDSLAAGDADALFAMGRAYMEGTAYPKDPVSAAAYLRAFASTGRPGAAAAAEVAGRITQSLPAADQQRVQQLKDELQIQFPCPNCGGPRG